MKHTISQHNATRQDSIYQSFLPDITPIIQGGDSSFSLYNKEYQQSYHSKSLGAYSETLYKHIIPVLIFKKSLGFSNQESSLLKGNRYSANDFETKFLDSMENIESVSRVFLGKRFYIKQQVMLENCAMPESQQSNLNRPLRILDICFGLGFNACMALQVFKNCEIYSPEKDNLLDLLKDFPYPENLRSQAYCILENLQTTNLYYDTAKNQRLYFLQGNALDIVQTFPCNFFDVVFQDAFSQARNSELWTTQYLKTLFNITSSQAVITTYAKARRILESARLAGFKVVKHALGSIFYKSDFLV
ncbi:MnmC family methyltransferase [Helicobacter sp. MIT 14-3879]|uniref:MnmC family methyltransferase n=1 Tax=Helicobacter sp. MIT 14-3879 TaxID=2040649 RepID=UPI000E1F1F49|nr:MnmC family methyltransferase [Helicobacter sp. MIT 14-3879]RDU59869.1 hypothetical protein CQA44_11105 [Helicobacter sp. MIT 14-3879]